MNDEKIEVALLRILHSNLQDELKEIEYNTDLREFGMDSMNCMAIIIEIESFFNIEFASDELVLRNFSTISKMARQVRKKMAIKDMNR